MGAHLVLSQRPLGVVVLPLHLIATDSGMSVSTRSRSHLQNTTCWVGAELLGAGHAPSPLAQVPEWGQRWARAPQAWAEPDSKHQRRKGNSGRGRGRKADHPSFHGPCSAQGPLDRGQAGRQRRRGPPSAQGGRAGGAGPAGLSRAHPEDHALTLGGSPGVGAGPSILRASAPRTP